MEHGKQTDPGEGPGRFPPVDLARGARSIEGTAAGLSAVTVSGMAFSAAVALRGCRKIGTRG